MSVAVAWCATRGFHVKITHQDTTHNHTLESGSYGNHPSVRRVQDEDVIDFVDELQAAGVKKKLMLQFLMKKTDKHVTLRDAHNFLREAEGSSVRVYKCGEKAGSWPSRILHSEREYGDHLRGLRQVSADYYVLDPPDATLPRGPSASVDGGRYPQHKRRSVQSLQLHDPRRLWAWTIRQHALMENERADCLTNAATSFKSFKATWDQVRVIIADKDFGEILLLQAARIVLCVFHVVKYLHGEIAKKEYNIQDRDKAEDAIHMMLDATTEVSHSWGHLEEVLKPSMPLDECVDPLQFLQSVAEMDYAKKMTDVGYMCYACADTETQKLAREVSQHAYQSVEKQYRVANDQKTEYTTREIQPHMIEMVSTVDTTRKYHLDTRTYHCSCIFVKTELLPHMHAIYWRLLANKSPIPIKNIYRRWDLTCPLNTPVEDEEDTEGEAAYTSF
ncbi:hypothetical protein PC110_g21188 [Phytophthora cactorum]|uniref:ZSWIM1/3 RNaseH-like domain-containing protein n=1 Tax=Phytophthora cactorum TaxID=29920 RepID=A0A329RDE0_9STRA|nr:hypothetical protein PC110_g21188 [Phytophthora cactorum]